MRASISCLPRDSRVRSRRPIGASGGTCGFGGATIFTGDDGRGVLPEADREKRVAAEAEGNEQAVHGARTPGERIPPLAEPAKVDLRRLARRRLRHADRHRGGAEAERGVREPVQRAVRDGDALQPEPPVDPARFLPATHPRWPHHWAVEPAAWRTPEDELLAGETRQIILEAIDALPPPQREVIVLRDVEGMPSTEVCNILEITDTHQRVLLHRARSRVRNALERYLAATETT